jgi:hypothetical protein
VVGEVLFPPSLPVGMICVFTSDGVSPHLIVERDDSESGQIKFRLSDCEFEYGDFRDASAEDYGAHKCDGFLVVASRKGDMPSLFEPGS